MRRTDREEVMPVNAAAPTVGNQIGSQRFRRSIGQSFNTRDGLALRWQVLAFCVVLVLLVSRDFSIFRHSQFYAEDGYVWFAQAYNYGWLHSLTRPEGGYLNTVQRLAAGIALFVPFRWAPMMMAIVGLLLQALPVPILLSERCRKWAPFSLRAAFAAVYVCIPDAGEIHVVCTNSQWHLALALLLIAFAATPRSFAAKAFDLCIVAVAAVTGPFPILAIPLVATFWAARRQRWTLVLLGILVAGSVIQVIYLLHNHEQRSLGLLGASPARFVRLLGGNAFLGALLGSRSWGLLLPFACSLAAMIAGLAACVYCARFSSIEVRLFFVYCFMIFAAGLRSPLISGAIQARWAALLTVPAQRYSFFPALALLFSILWLAGFAPSIPMRITGSLLVLVLCVGIIRDWKIAPMGYMDFSRHAAAFKSAPAGSDVIIPVYCNGGDCHMELIKKSR